MRMLLIAVPEATVTSVRAFALDNGWQWQFSAIPGF